MFNTSGEGWERILLWGVGCQHSIGLVTDYERKRTEKENFPQWAELGGSEPKPPLFERIQRKASALIRESWLEGAVLAEGQVDRG